MTEDWDGSACLGPAPHFHADPALDGPPLSSPDGHWWWDGHRWRPSPLGQDHGGHDRRRRDRQQPTPA